MSFAQEIGRRLANKSSNRISQQTQPKNPFIDVVSTRNSEKILSYPEFESQSTTLRDPRDPRTLSDRVVEVKPNTMTYGKSDFVPSTKEGRDYVDHGNISYSTRFLNPIRSTEEYAYVQNRDRIRTKPEINVSNIPSRVLYSTTSSADLNRMLNESADLKEFDKKDRRNTLAKIQERFVDKTKLAQIWQKTLLYKAYLAKIVQEQMADLDKTAKYGAANVQKTVVDVPVNIMPVLTETKATAPATTLAASVLGMSRSMYVKGDNANSLGFSDLIQENIEKDAKLAAAQAARQQVKTKSRQYLEESFEKLEKERAEIEEAIKERKKHTAAEVERRRDLFSFLNKPQNNVQSTEEAKVINPFDNFSDIFSDENVKKRQLTN